MIENSGLAILAGIAVVGFTIIGFLLYDIKKAIENLHKFLFDQAWKPPR